MRKSPILVLFAVCFGVELLVLALFRGPAPVPIRHEGSDQFSAAAAMNLIQEVFPEQPHPAGSPQNAEVRERLTRILQTHGWDVEPIPDSGPASNIPQNILASRPELNSRSGTPLLLASHYDSCASGPGIGDAAVCVAAVIEAARQLTRVPESIRRPVWILLTDAEESGLKGAHWFVTTHPLARKRPIVLNFDARGNAGPVVMFETHQGNLEMIRDLSNSFVKPRLTGSLFTAVYRTLPNGTDFTEFASAGFRGFNFALIDGAHHYHQPTDTTASLDRRSLQHLGETALSTGLAIATSASEFTDTREDAVFFDVLGQSVIQVPRSWLAILRFVILFLAVQIYGRNLISERARGQIVVVWATMAILLPFASFLGWGVSSSLQGTWLLPRKFVSWGHWLTLAEWFLCVISCGTLAAICLRRCGRPLLWNAFWLAHAFTNMVVSLLLPEFACLLTVPALLALAATMLVSNLVLRTMLVSCLCVVLLIPLHHLVAIALGPASGTLLFPAFALIVMPALPLLGRPRLAFVEKNFDNRPQSDSAIVG